MQTYFLEPNGNHDFLQFIETENKFCWNYMRSCSSRAEKIAAINKSKEKPALKDEDITYLTIHVESKMETVYLGERLTEDSFFTMLCQILASLFSFTSHRSGWMLKEINGLYV